VSGSGKQRRRIEHVVGRRNISQSENQGAG
jgi:hypothetical protein